MNRFGRGADDTPHRPGEAATVEAHTLDGTTATAPAAGGSTSILPTSSESRWVIADRYEVRSLLGTGGMGSVYRVWDRELEEVVALKMISGQLASSEDALDRFKREVKLARRVTHRNVARTFDIGEHAGVRFLTMELVEGELLGALLARRGRLRFEEVIRIGRDLCDALGAAHAAGIIHRDLKPENVVIAADGRTVVTDFGIARAVQGGESARSAAGILVGTPAYMAPEQLEGVHDLDARVDVYALGAMLFELFAGVPPWTGESMARAAIARLHGEPPDVRIYRPALSEAVASVVSRCMARHREDRYQSAAEVAQALSGLAAPLDSSRTPPPSAASDVDLASRELANATPPPRRALATNPAAYDLYLRGRGSYLKGWYDVAAEAMDLLGQAHQLAPTDAMCAATYARSLARAYGVDGRGEDVARAAQVAAEKALAAEPALAEARVALAMIHLYRGEGVAAASELRRALANDPTDAASLELTGRLRVEVGPVETAVDLLVAALEREPTFNEARYSLARAWANLGNWEECAAILGAMPNDPRELVPYLLHRARFLSWARDVAAMDELLSFMPQLAKLMGRESRVLETLLGVGVRRAITANEEVLLDVAFATGADVNQRRASFNAQIRAEVYFSGNDVDAALRSMLEADANGLIDLTWLDRCPLLDAARDHETFATVRRATAIRAARIRDALDVR